MLVFCANPDEVRDWAKLHCGPLQDKLLFFEIREPQGSGFPVLRLQMALDAFSWWRLASRAIRRAQSESGYAPDLVFFAWLDGCLGRYQSHHLIDLLFPYDWSGLYFHPRHLRLPLPHSAAQGGPHDYDEALRSRHCRSVALLDEGVAERLRERLPGKEVLIFPDLADASPPDDSFPVRQEIIAKAGARKVITLIGGVAKRKGILTLLACARKMSQAECFFVFAGSLAEETFEPDELQSLRELAADPPHNCYFNFNFVPGEAQFNALVEMSDLLFASYEDFPHSSNILAKAALFKKPVIVSKGHCMEERVNAFRMGESIEYGNVTQCVEAISRLLDTEPQRADFAGYLQCHSQERLRLAFQGICNSCFM